MLRQVRAKVLHGKLELLENVELPEGAEVTVLVPAKDRTKSLFGLLKGSISINGDIISPIDVG